MPESPREIRVRCASEMRFPGSNARDRFTHSLTHSLTHTHSLTVARSLSATTRQQQQQTLPLPTNPHHIPSHQERYNSEQIGTLVFSKQQPAQFVIANSRVSIYASLCYADRHIPPALRWTHSSKPIPAPAAMRDYCTTAFSGSHPPEARQFLWPVSSVCPWSYRRRYSNT